jgi:hypothetical protein
MWHHWLVPKGENKYFLALHKGLLEHFKKLESIDGRNGCSKVSFFSFLGLLSTRYTYESNDNEI